MLRFVRAGQGTGSPYKWGQLVGPAAGRHRLIRVLDTIIQLIYESTRGLNFSDSGGRRCRRPERRGPVDRWSQGMPNCRSMRSRSGRRCGSRASTPGTSRRPGRARGCLAADRGAPGGPIGRRRTAPRRGRPSARAGDPPGHLVRRFGRGRVRRVRALQRRARTAPRPRRASVGGRPHPALAPRALRPERRVGVWRLAQDRRPAARRARPQRTAAGPDASCGSRRARPPDRPRRAAGAHHRGARASAGGLAAFDRGRGRLVARDRAQRAREAAGRSTADR